MTISVSSLVISASEFTTDTTLDPAAVAGAAIGGGLIALVIGVVLGGFAVMGMFKKAGRKTWEAFIPVYSSVVLFRIVGMSGWWALAMFVPFLNIAAIVLLAINLAKVFGQGAGIAVLIFFFNVIMYFYLSYGSARYFGPQASKGDFGLADNPNQPAYAPAAH